MIVRRLRAWLKLAPGDGLRLLAMMVALPTIGAALRVFAVVRAQEWLKRRSEVMVRRVADPRELQTAENLARLADTAGRHGLIGANCLRQALLLYWLLRRRGLAPALKLGVRKEGGLFAAHAWIELQGKALGHVTISHAQLNRVGGPLREHEGGVTDTASSEWFS